MLKVKKSILVETIIPGVAGGNTGTRFQIPDQPYLRNKKIVAIESYNASDIPTSPSQTAVAAFNQMQGTFLTLYTNEKTNPNKWGEFVKLVPLVCLHRMVGAAGAGLFVWHPFELVGQTIIWEKSYFTLPTAFANVADVSLLLNVYFED